jgi:TolB protein
MNRILFLIAFLLCCLSLKADDPILIRLDTEVKRLPMHVSKMINENSAFDSEYLQELEKILSFDLNHNGMVVTVDQAKQRQVVYILKVRSKDKALMAQLFTVNTQTNKTIDPIPLSGDLRFDRRQIHLLADAVYRAMFGKNGVASTHILYTIKTKGKTPNTWISEVYEADYDGGNPRQLTRDGDYCVTPCYVPPKPGLASGSFFYVSYKNGQPKIYMASLKDGTGRRFSTMRGNQLLPAVSMQRDKVAFINDITGNPDLFLQPFNPDVGAMGKPHQIFSHGKATQGTPAFSPDGKKIAFVSNKDGSPKVYVMVIPDPGTNLKHIKAKLISKTNRESSAPSWSPDGTKLAYCSLTEGARQIWIHDFEKDGEWQLTLGPENKENPTWAPDSLHLVFNSTGKSGSELYLVNLNQPEAVKITNGPGEKRFPNWEPSAVQ